MDQGRLERWKVTGIGEKRPSPRVWIKPVAG